MPLVRIPPSFAVPQLQLRGSHRAMQSQLTPRSPRRWYAREKRERAREEEGGSEDDVVLPHLASRRMGRKQLRLTVRVSAVLKVAGYRWRLHGLIAFLGSMFIPRLLIVARDAN